MSTPTRLLGLSFLLLVLQPVHSLAGGGGGASLLGGSRQDTPPERPPAVPWRLGEGPVSVDQPSMLHAEGPLLGVRMGPGEFVHDEVDLVILGRGFDFVWARRYRSRSPHELDTAQGINWDYSYNLWVEENPWVEEEKTRAEKKRSRGGLVLNRRGSLILHDGHGRADSYGQQTNGTYIRPGQFVVGTKNANSSTVFTFPDQGSWNFRPLDAPVAPGRIESIVDRNGNTMSFTYDNLDRLATVNDTLGRTITLSHDAAGRIASVTDFTGRSVTYSHYDGTTAGGSAGDLESVTTPVVTGTPNGNDFPAGKTTTYAYAKGTSSPELDHNLLTITDAKGQTWLVNTYGAGTTGAPPTFDRVVSQQWGSPGEDLQLTYVDPSRGHVRAITNDRRGVVREYEFDRRFRLIEFESFTGFADRALPTTPGANRPTGMLRPGDPDSFVTTYLYNRDSLLVTTVLPDLNVVNRTHEIDIDHAAQRNAAGNLRRLRRLPGPRGADQTSLLSTWQYGPHAFVTQYTDPLGRTTSQNYDSNGNRTMTETPDAAVKHNYEHNSFGQLTAHVLPADNFGMRRRDERVYYAAGAQEGYLKEVIVDATGLALKTQYACSSVGVITGRTAPEGNDTQFVLNALDQVVRTKSAALSSVGGVRYERDYSYDENDNIVRVDVQNVDEAGVVSPGNSHLTTAVDYDLLNRPSSILREGGLQAEWLYDPSGNRTLVRGHRAISGSDPHHTARFTHDERDLLFRVTKAEGGADQTTTQSDYNGRGWLTAKREGLEATPRVTAFEYDGYDRLVAATDAMGNRTIREFDAASRRVSQALHGELLDVPSGDNNILLEDISYGYDSLDRLITETWAHFDTSTGLPIGAGTSTWTTTYDGLGGALTVTDPNGNVTTAVYDSAHRTTSMADPTLMLLLSRDANSRVISRTELHSGDASGPHTTLLQYDEVDRLVQQTNSAGEVSTIGYGSRGLRRLTTDGRGNLARRTYDSLGQLTSIVEMITDDGTGAGVVTGARTMTYDPALEGIRTVTDDNGNTTSYEYDALDRLTRSTRADGTVVERAFDVFSDMVQVTEPTGTQTDFSYDGLGRHSARLITPGLGISMQTTNTSYTWNGRGLLVDCSDDNSSIQRTLDSLGALLQEVQTLGLMSGSPMSGTVNLEVDAMGLTTGVSYPGGRNLQISRDAGNRAASISEGGSAIVVNNWIGPDHRLASRDFENGTTTSFAYDLALRPIRALTTGAGPLVDRTATWNASGDMTSRGNALPLGTDFWFAIDSLGRPANSTETPSAALIVYGLDDLGNRMLVGGGPDPGAYTMDPTLPGPGDYQMNQYSTTPFDVRGYDDNGNLSSRSGTTGLDLLTWDSRGDLVEHQDGATGDLTKYTYDPLGRRVSKVLKAFTAPQETRYFYLGDRLIEEQDVLGTTMATYIWSEVDGGQEGSEVVAMRRGGSDYYLHNDATGNIAAVTDAAGNIAEWYEYGDFGELRIFDAQNQTLSQSAIGNSFLFRQLWWDSESRSYLGEAIRWDPALGRGLSVSTGGSGFDLGPVANNGSGWERFGYGPDDGAYIGHDHGSLEQWFDYTVGQAADNEVRAIMEMMDMIREAMTNSGETDSMGCPAGTLYTPADIQIWGNSGACPETYEEKKEREVDEYCANNPCNEPGEEEEEDPDEEEEEDNSITAESEMDIPMLLDLPGLSELSGIGSIMWIDGIAGATPYTLDFGYFRLSSISGSRSAVSAAYGLQYTCSWH